MAIPINPDRLGFLYGSPLYCNTNDSCSWMTGEPLFPSSIYPSISIVFAGNLRKSPLPTGKDVTLEMVLAIIAFWVIGVKLSAGINPKGKPRK